MLRCAARSPVHSDPAIARDQWTAEGLACGRQLVEARAMRTARSASKGVKKARSTALASDCAGALEMVPTRVIRTLTVLAMTGARCVIVAVQRRHSNVHFNASYDSDTRIAQRIFICTRYVLASQRRLPRGCCTETQASCGGHLLCAASAPAPLGHGGRRLAWADRVTISSIDSALLRWGGP